MKSLLVCALLLAGCGGSVAAVTADPAPAPTPVAAPAVAAGPFPVPAAPLTASGLTVSLDSATVRSDHGSVVLSIGYSLAVAQNVWTDCLHCLHSFDPLRELRLEAPNGSWIAATAGRGVATLEGGAPGSPGVVDFTIPAGSAAYQLVLTPTNGFGEEVDETGNPSSSAPSLEIAIGAR